MNCYAPDYGNMKMKIVGVVKAVLGYECQHVYIYILDLDTYIHF